MPEHSDKLVVSIDSQWLETLQECHRKMDYKFVKNLRPIKTSEALEKGSLLHEILDIFYQSYGEAYDERVKLAIAHGQRYAIKLSLPMEDCSAVIFQFREYADHYKMDGWRPLLAPDSTGKMIPLIEHTFSIVLHEDEEIKIIYSGKIDLVAETPVGIILVDHKSESRKSDPSTLTNQFIGYVNALKIYNMWINKVGFQKTLSRAERFRRYIKSYNPDWVEEWKVGIIQDIKRAALALQSGVCYPNFTACDRSFWGCEYKSLCETTKDNREFKAKTFFMVGEPWDPYGKPKNKETT